MSVDSRPSSRLSAGKKKNERTSVNSYPYAVGRIKALESRLFDRSKWNRLLDLNEADALKYLVEIGYGTGAGDAGNIDELIKAEIASVRALIWEITPDEELTGLFLLEADAHNLKALFKARLLGTDADEILVRGGWFSPESLKKSVEEHDFSGMPKALAEGLKKVDEEAERERNPQALSAAVDKQIFEFILSRLKHKKNTFLDNYFRTKIDLINVMSVIRAKILKWSAEKLMPLLIPGGRVSFEEMKEAMEAPWNSMEPCFRDPEYGRIMKNAAGTYMKIGRVLEVEKLMDDVLMKIVLEEKNDSFGVGPLVHYQLMKESEARSLRILFAAKKAGLSVSLSELTGA